MTGLRVEVFILKGGPFTKKIVLCLELIVCRELPLEVCLPHAYLEI